jgi:hypothetical protein
MATPTPIGETARAQAFAGIECRVWERQPCDLQTFCQPIAARADNDVMWPARLRDISPGGAGLVVGRRYEPRSVLAVEFPGNGAIPTDVLFARVVHATALADGYWLLGCAFASELSEFEIQNLLSLAQPQLAPPAEKTDPVLERLTLRIVGKERPASADQKPSGRSFVLMKVAFEGTTRTGALATVLVRRLYLTGSWPLAAGTTVEGWLGSKSDTVPALKWKINSCEHKEERWTVNYSFVNTPSADVARLLGHPDSAD